MLAMRCNPVLMRCISVLLGVDADCGSALWSGGEPLIAVAMSASLIVTSSGRTWAGGLPLFSLLRLPFFLLFCFLDEPDVVCVSFSPPISLSFVALCWVEFFSFRC